MCTITSLISCLNGYWLDNNAANCIRCDPFCMLCSSTTRCSVCQEGYYLRNDFSCGSCMGICLSCGGNSSCLTCKVSNEVFNSSSGQCQGGVIVNCVLYDSTGKCIICDNSSYLDQNTGQCIPINALNLVQQCQTYQVIANGSIICSNCSNGFFNSTDGCHFGCSVLCTACYGPHYGLCYGC